METEAKVQTERVDDIPLLVEQLRIMGVPQILNEIIPVHGNHQGLSVGWIAAVWLAYILSEADHRLSRVEPWAEAHLRTLERLLPEAVRSQDFTDDRMADVLDYLSDDADWQLIEQEMGQYQVQVFVLPKNRAWLDSTTTVVYHDPEGNPLLRYGVSKDHRPDLAQFKIMMSELQGIGVPVATLIVPGNQADDGLYLPVFEQSRLVLGDGLLYIGDSKMEAVQTRAQMAASHNFYLVPLSQKGENSTLLRALVDPVLDKKQALVEIRRPDPDSGEERLVAKAYETGRQQEATLSTGLMQWQERILAVYSDSLAKQAADGLDGRLQRTMETLSALAPTPGRGKRPATDLATLQAQVQQVLRHHRVEDLIQVDYERHESQRKVRKYKERPARVETGVYYQLRITQDQAAIATLRRYCGWRLFVTNAPEDRMDIADAVLTYRQSPANERGFSRLKNHPLGLRPIYLHQPQRINGLVRLLSVALRLLTLTEFVVRRSLHEQDQLLGGLYPGNPARTTQRPTTERILQAFKNINLTFVELPGHAFVHITPLTQLQQSIISLLGFTDDLYSQLVNPTLVNSP